MFTTCSRGVTKVQSEEIMIKLQKIFRDIFDDEIMTVTTETSKNDLEAWDSVSHIKLVLSIEDEFKIHFSTDEVLNIKSVMDFITAIEKNQGI